jgi:hypothetical protein
MTRETWSTVYVGRDGAAFELEYPTNICFSGMSNCIVYVTIAVLNTAVSLGMPYNGRKCHANPGVQYT